MIAKKVLLVSSCALLLAACNSADATRETTHNYKRYLPPELVDCKVFVLDPPYGAKLHVVRCSNSTTSTTERQGKVDVNVVTIDGVEYVKKGK